MWNLFNFNAEPQAPAQDQFAPEGQEPPVIVETQPRRHLTIPAHPTPALSALQVEQIRLQSLMIQRERAAASDSPTKQLEESSPDILSILRQLAPPSAGEGSLHYQPLPNRHITDIMSPSPCWRIELHGLKAGAAPLGIDVRGDVVIGRGPDADLDLDAYGGYQQAVSRRHAMLRPTNRQLFLIDLGSTNGTTYNMIPLARCSTYALQHNDVVTLGLLTMTIKILHGPQGLVVAKEAGVFA